MTLRHLLLPFCLLLAGVTPANAQSQTPRPAAAKADAKTQTAALARSVPAFNDLPLEEPVKYPSWFKLGIGNLRTEVKEAAKAGKTGIMVYFGQKRCPYCEKFLRDVELPDISRELRKHFDVIPVDIWGIDEVVTMQGDKLTEQEMAVREQAHFTPTVIFYDAKGKEALRLRGYYSPYQFRAALKFITEGFYKTEDFRAYLARAKDNAFVFEPGELNQRDFLAPPPFALDRTRRKAQQPLLVLFEQGNCHACDLLHTGPLNDRRLVEAVKDFEVVQLDMWSDTPVLTPDGRRTSARKWAEDLNLFYTPSLVFFDEGGKEIIRVDHVAQFYRLMGVFEFVRSGGYRTHPNFRAWRFGRKDEGL